MNVRQIVLDTETTGLDTAEGHRIIEIGCVELINRRLTRNNYRQYLNPDRDIDEGALAVHGITREFLRDQPRFRDIVRDFLAFIKDSELIIHNADFDVGFINLELKKIGAELGEIGDYCAVLDTLHLARQAHPGQRNSLDALCKRYEIDNSQRELHGALLDAEILADVYLAMTGGQTALLLDDLVVEERPARKLDSPLERAELTVIYADEEEAAAHEDWLKLLDEKSGGRCLWRTV
jgi:DNA polymerase-3 subunit epsilon